MRQCTADADLTDDEINHLNALPNAANEIEASYSVECELQDGHTGPHQGLAQSDTRSTDDSINWWLRWAAGVREWTHEPCCYVENAETAELCMIPAGHEGPHAFG